MKTLIYTTLFITVLGYISCGLFTNHYNITLWTEGVRYTFISFIIIGVLTGFMLKVTKLDEEF